MTSTTFAHATLSWSALVPERKIIQGDALPNRVDFDRFLGELVSGPSLARHRPTLLQRIQPASCEKRRNSATFGRNCARDRLSLPPPYELQARDATRHKMRSILPSLPGADRAFGQTSANLGRAPAKFAALGPCEAIIAKVAQFATVSAGDVEGDSVHRRARRTRTTSTVLHRASGAWPLRGVASVAHRPNTDAYHHPVARSSRTVTAIQCAFGERVV